MPLYTLEENNCSLEIKCDGELYKVLPLCGIIFKAHCPSQLTLVSGDESFTASFVHIDGFDSLQDIVDEFGSKAKECCNTGTVTVEGDLNVPKFSSVPLEVCRIGTDELCTIIWCYDEGGDSVFYTDPFTGETFNQLEFTTTFEKPTGGTELPTQIWYALEDKKGDNPICVVPFQDAKGGLDYYLQEDFDLNDLSNPLNIKEYNIMGVSIGSPYSESLMATLRNDRIQFCIDAGVTLTETNLIDLAVAQGITDPDGNPPTAFINGVASSLYPGQTAKDAEGNKKKLKQGFCIEQDGKVINYGTSLPDPQNPPIDKDCDKLIVCQETTVANTGTEQGAGWFCADWGQKDDDDTTPFAGEGGEEEGR